jgi:hypothetical protein
VDRAPEIQSQDNAYRRGLVLGLTMAEIMVLILFTLLLALAATIASKEAEIVKRDERLAAFASFEQQLASILRDNPSGVTVDDIIQRIVRQRTDMKRQQEALDKLEQAAKEQREAANRLREEVEKQRAELLALQKENDRLKQFEGAGQIVEDVIRALRRSGDKTTQSSQLAEKIPQLVENAGKGDGLERENANLQGQVAQMIDKLKGRGNEFPSCWVAKVAPGQKRDDGKPPPPVSIFEITITSGGIIVLDRELPDWKVERTALSTSLTKLNFGKQLSASEFRTQLADLYEYSVKNNCRFYMIRFTTERDVSRDFLNSIDRFFYPDSSLQYRPEFPKGAVLDAGIARRDP